MACETCDIELLEGFAEGTLPAPEREALQAHLEGCAECRNELTWIEQEQALFARRAQAQLPVSKEVLAAAERKLRPPRPERRAIPRWARRARVGLLLVGAAAAALAVVVLRGPHLPGTTSSHGQQNGQTPETVAQGPVASSKEDVHAARINEAEHAIDNAEAEYQKAATLLEAEYAEGRSKLNPALAKKYDAMLADTKQGLALAKESAGRDVGARVRVLDGYAAYVRSLQHAVYDIPEDHSR